MCSAVWARVTRSCLPRQSHTSEGFTCASGLLSDAWWLLLCRADAHQVCCPPSSGNGARGMTTAGKDEDLLEGPLHVPCHGAPFTLTHGPHRRDVPRPVRPRALRHGRCPPPLLQGWVLVLGPVQLSISGPGCPNPGQEVSELWAAGFQPCSWGKGCRLQITAQMPQVP